MNIGDITLEQLMSEDYYVIMKNNPKFGFNITLLSDELAHDVVSEGVHPDAMASFAFLCRNFLWEYEKCEKELLK